MPNSNVRLVPWDPDAPDHVARLASQRAACGWDADKVAAWRGLQRAGEKCVYWIALSPEDPDVEEMVSRHTARFPEEMKPLKDTAKSIRGVPRAPPQPPCPSTQPLLSFRPIGHISLDVDNPPATKLLGALGLLTVATAEKDESAEEKKDESAEEMQSKKVDCAAAAVYWIKSLYVSPALQGRGIGRAAMDEVEAVAAGEPLCARVLMLDTLAREDQNTIVSTQDWYTRRGYKHIWTEKGFYARNGAGSEYDHLRVVFMRREL